MNYSRNKILAAAAVVLALFAAVIGDPVHRSVNVKEIARLVEEERDHIAPRELAERLYAGETIRLIDLRDSASYASSHIPNAVRMDLQQLLSDGVKRNEKTVLYSEGGIHASQAWILLKTEHYDSVFTLLGGFAGWKEEILYPVLKDSADSFRRTLSKHFGGEPVDGSKKISTKRIVPGASIPKKVFPPVPFKQEEEKLRDQC